MKDFIKLPICDKETLRRQIQKRTLPQFLRKKLIEASKDEDVMLYLSGICEVIICSYEILYFDLKDSSNDGILEPVGKPLDMTDAQFWTEASLNLAILIEDSYLGTKL